MCGQESGVLKRPVLQGWLQLALEATPTPSDILTNVTDALRATADEWISREARRVLQRFPSGNF